MKVIATDLDGTLFWPRRYVSLMSKRNKKFIRRFINDGGLFITSSARNRFFAQKTAHYVGNPLNAICCSGSLIFHEGEKVKDTSFAKGEAEELIAKVSKIIKPRIVILSTRDVNAVYDPTTTNRAISNIYRLVQLYLRAYREPYVRDHDIFQRELNKANIYKILLVIGILPHQKKKIRKTVKVLRDKFPEAEFSWVGEGIEITPKDCTKANALRFYLDKYKIPTDNIYVVGDGGNDTSSFDEFKGHGYCLKHAPKNVKRHAAFVIRRFYDLEKYIYPLEEKPLNQERR